MKKEQFKIEIKVNLDKDSMKPHYLNAERTFVISATRQYLFRSLEAVENRLKKLYPTDVIDEAHDTGEVSSKNSLNNKVILK